MEQHEVEQVQESLEAVEQLNETPEVQEEAPKEQVSDTNVNNIRRLREDRERLQRENEELRRYYQQAAPQQQQKDEDDFDIDPDQFAEGKHLKKIAQENKKLRQEMKRIEEGMIETRLKSQFPDFEKVVNNDTIAQLREQHPEIASMLVSTTDKYAQAAGAYKFIRNMGIYQDQSHQQDRQRVQTNAAKPKPSNAIGSHGNTPLSQANAFANGRVSKEEKQRLWEEMQQNMRGQ